MICEQCMEPASDTLPDGEPACDTCLTLYWEQVLEDEGLSFQFEEEPV